MKSKITLSILIVVIIFLGALSFFFGYNYLNEKDTVKDLNEKVETLTQLTENMNQEIENKEEVKVEEPKVEGDNNQEVVNTKNTTTYFTSEDNKYLLILANYEDRKLTSKANSDGVEKYFILLETYPQAQTMFAGGYYINNGTINLSFNKSNNSIKDVTIENVYGTERATLAYDEANGVITLGNVKLYKK